MEAFRDAEGGRVYYLGKVVGHKSQHRSQAFDQHVWVAAIAVAGDQQGEITKEKMQKTVQLIKADEEGEEDTNNQREKID